jgi:phage host-nuclease inhibitor protein Gam
MTARKRKKKSQFVPEPVKSLEDALKADKKIADMLRKRAEREARARERFAKAAKLLKQFLGESLDDIVIQFEELRKFVFEHRDDLFPADKKSTAFPTGAEIEFYLGGKAVILDRNTKTEEFIARFKALELTQFIRTKEYVNRQALQLEPEVAKSIAGITVRDSEEYFAYHPQERTETFRYNLETGKIRLTTPDEDAQGESDESSEAS